MLADRPNLHGSLLMLATFAPLLFLAQAADCPDPDTAVGQFRIRQGELSCEEIAEREAKDQIPPRSITAAEKQRIMAHFDQILVDGPSARWQWGKVVRGHVACLSVNSKNRMGGYAGWSRYTFDLETGEETRTAELEALMERLGMPNQVRDICA